MDVKLLIEESSWKILYTITQDKQIMYEREGEKLTNINDIILA